MRRGAHACKPENAGVGPIDSRPQLPTLTGLPGLPGLPGPGCSLLTCLVQAPHVPWPSGAVLHQHTLHTHHRSRPQPQPPLPVSRYGNKVSGRCFDRPGASCNTCLDVGCSWKRIGAPLNPAGLLSSKEEAQRGDDGQGGTPCKGRGGG